MTAQLPGIAFFAAVAVTLAQSPQAPSPQDCVKQGRDFTSKRQQELRPLTAEIVKQIDAERVKIVRACAASFDVAKAPVDQLAAMVELYMDAQQPDLAERAIALGTSEAITPRTRAEVLASAVRFLMRQPRSAERNARAERYSDMLDALPDEALEQKIAAHSSLNSYYRGDDIDAGIIKHSTWLIDTAKKAPPELRKKYGNNLVAAYINLAEAVAGQGDTEKALDLLRRAPAEMADVPKAEDRVRPARARYELVGKPAAAVTAPVWLNAPDSGKPLDLEGKVTLLQFTAHWCGPCKESYPGMTRLQQRFNGRPFQIAFYTRTYGYFEGERNLAREQEIEKDRAYYAHYGFTHPIAIGTPSSTMVDGKPVYQEDPVEKAYGVGGIPQINVIDAQGNLRLIMIGYDDANEEKLARFIESLMKKTLQP